MWNLDTHAYTEFGHRYGMAFWAGVRAQKVTMTLFGVLAKSIDTRFVIVWKRTFSQEINLEAFIKA